MLKPFALVVGVVATLSGCQSPPDAAAQRLSDPEPPIVAQGALEGTYFVSGPMAEGDLVRDSTHLYLWMEGDLAAELYRRMPAVPKPQRCGDEDAWIKQGREIACTAAADSTDYRCYVAVDVPGETLVAGVTC